MSFISCDKKYKQKFFLSLFLSHGFYRRPYFYASLRIPTQVLKRWLLLSIVMVFLKRCVSEAGSVSVFRNGEPILKGPFQWADLSQHTQCSG
jgi:hypothetical protein